MQGTPFSICHPCSVTSSSDKQTSGDTNSYCCISLALDATNTPSRASDRPAVGLQQHDPVSSPHSQKFSTGPLNLLDESSGKAFPGLSPSSSPQPALPGHSTGRGKQVDPAELPDGQVLCLSLDTCDPRISSAVFDITTEASVASGELFIYLSQSRVKMRCQHMIIGNKAQGS